MPRVTIHCAHCGKPKDIYPCRVQEKNYCNHTCRGAYKTAHGIVTLNCELCGKEYKTCRFFHEQRSSRFCSRKCLYATISNERMGNKNVNYVEPILKVCPICKNEFSIKPGVEKQGYGTCCCKKCAGEYYSIRFRRNTHWKWKGGKHYDYGVSWKRIASEIRRRDNYICQYCGKKKKGNIQKRSLQVHHIKKIRDFNGDYDSANNPQNLITLCTTCHNKAESGLITIQHKLL